MILDREKIAIFENLKKLTRKTGKTQNPGKHNRLVKNSLGICSVGQINVNITF